jgi:hypothetical protein
MPTRKYFGNAAHFIGADACRFHIATRIGEVVVSTVGEYRPQALTKFSDPNKDTEIGYGRTFETMVFRVNGECKCGCGVPSHDGRELDVSVYQNPKDANAGHEAMCAKWEDADVQASVEEIANVD